MISDNLGRRCSTPIKDWHREEALVPVRTKHHQCLGCLTETKVPGKNTVVRTAITFMAELSRLLAWAISFESRATSMLRVLSCCAMRLKSYEHQSPLQVVRRSQPTTFCCACNLPSMAPYVCMCFNVLSAILTRSIRRIVDSSVPGGFTEDGPVKHEYTKSWSIVAFRIKLRMSTNRQVSAPRSCASAR